MPNPNPTRFQTGNSDAPAQDRGLFDCFGKKEDKKYVPVTKAEHKPSLMEKLHRSGSSSSSSSEEEVEEDGMKIRRRKKKGLTDKIKEKLPGHKNEAPAAEVIQHTEEKKGLTDKMKEKLPGHKKETPTPERIQDLEEKKGFMEKIKDKMPGQHKEETIISSHQTPAYAAAPAHDHAAAPAYVAAPVLPHRQPGGQCGAVHGAHESQDKKGFFEKITEKLPGGHKDGDEVKKTTG